MDEQIEILRAKKARALLGGGQDKIQKQHQRGKLTARERLNKVLDDGSFVEQHMLAGEYEDTESGIYGDGIATGFGKIEGRTVGIYSQDTTIYNASVGPVHRSKICHVIDDAARYRLPVIGLHDGAGARLEIPGASLERGLDRPSVFTSYVKASGVVPQIMAILGPCSGNAVYGPALADFIFVVEGIGFMFITGPRAVKEMLGVDVTMEELGNARLHSEVSGIADFCVPTEEECFRQIRKLVSFLPANNTELPPVVKSGDSPDRLINDLGDIVPDNPRKPFDMHQVINRIVDNGDFLEVKSGFAKNMIVGFGRLNGRTAGFVANQPLFLAGSLTVDSSDKEARFIRFCNAFNIPLVFLVDTPGYMPGIDQERAGIIRHGAKVLYAITEAVVPKVTVLLRKRYGGANPAMGGDRDLGVDQIFAWPACEGSVMGAEGSVEIFYQKEIRAAQNPAEYKAQKVREFREKFANPYNLATTGVIDDVIEPAETRSRLIKAIERCLGKCEAPIPRKYGNMPI